VSDLERRSPDDYRERDELIMQQLRSSDDAVRKEGWKKVDRTYRRPLAKLLWKIATSSKSPAYRAILDQNQRVDGEVFAELWQYICLSLWKIQETDFKVEKTLLAYLVKIAVRWLVSRWRAKRGYQLSVELEGFPAKPIVGELPDLLRDIQIFYDDLNEEDQKALSICMQFVTQDTSRKVSVQEFVKVVRLSGAWGGDYVAISRRFLRLRKKLREFLRERGHNV
jgi:hypothetical protein